MLQLGLWIGLCGAAAFVLRRKPFILVVAVLALMFFVPTVGSPLITGQSAGPLSLHAGSWLIFLTAAVQLLFNSDAVARVISKYAYLFLTLAVVAVAGILATEAQGSGGGLVVLVDQVMAPVVLFIVIVSLGPKDPALVTKLRAVLLTFAAAVSVIAVIQWSTHSVLFYENGFETQYWFTPEQSRWMGTFDQPLALSFALCTVAALLAGVRRLAIQLPLLALFATAVLTTQSRVGILIFLAVALLVVMRSTAKFLAKAFMLVVLVTAGYLFYDSPLAAGVLGRFVDDTGSGQAREAATRFFLDTWPQFILTGQGMTSSYQVGQTAGLGTSLESSILMYSIDVGVLFALMYFGSMVFIVLRGARAKIGGGLVLAGVLAVAIPQTYSSLATRSVAGIIVWTILALIVVATDARSAAGDRGTNVGEPGIDYQRGRSLK
ncbi:hypothetical protein ACX80E_06925 [Arthrobacter sp. TMN-49]